MMLGFKYNFIFNTNFSSLFITPNWSAISGPTPPFPIRNGLFDNSSRARDYRPTFSSCRELAPPLICFMYIPSR